MQPTNLALMVFTGVIGAAVLFMGMSIYNGLVELRNQADRSWANIDVILKQRHDEIPNLVSVCEQFAGFERSLLDRLMKARARYGQASTTPQKVVAASEVGGALQSIFALSEAYPQLKSSEHFLQFQSRISQLENHIADRREHFNETVTNFNTRIMQLPDVFVARFLGYTALELYKVRDSERIMPSVRMKIPA